MNEEASSRAVASLVLGILSYVACPLIFGIAAIVLGSGERHGVARAGVILGWINVALSILSLIAAVVFFVFVGAASAVGH
jgi:hypothetical protein